MEADFLEGEREDFESHEIKTGWQNQGPERNQAGSVVVAIASHAVPGLPQQVDKAQVVVGDHALGK